jgi:hypothetical protein
MVRTTSGKYHIPETRSIPGLKNTAFNVGNKQGQGKPQSGRSDSVKRKSRNDGPGFFLNKFSAV